MVEQKSLPALESPAHGRPLVPTYVRTRYSRPRVSSWSCRKGAASCSQACMNTGYVGTRLVPEKRSTGVAGILVPTCILHTTYYKLPHRYYYTVALVRTYILHALVVVII